MMEPAISVGSHNILREAAPPQYRLHSVYDLRPLHTKIGMLLGTEACEAACTVRINCWQPGYVRGISGTHSTAVQRSNTEAVQQYSLVCVHMPEFFSR
eukprot:SAG11_NODE_12186_length_717_cov_0.736246_1_plen_97_part_10